MLIFSCWNCEDFFHPEEISIGEIKSYDELLKAVGGVYGKLGKALNDIFIYKANIKGDDLNLWTSNYSGFYEEGTCWSEYPYDISSDVAWNLLYSTVASVNNIICQYNINSFPDQKTSELIGELYFIRAYCYFRLTRTYGEIPLIEDTDISFSVTKASYNEIYSFIEDDISNALSLLPKSNNESRIPYHTPHRGTAKALLAELYLSWAGYPASDHTKYNYAAKEAEEVIDSAEYFGFGLLDNFAQLWECQYLYNQEEIFTIFFQNPSETESIEEINHIYVGRTYDYSYGQFFMLEPGSPFISQIFYCSELKFYNDYPVNYRKEITFYSRIYVPADYFPQDTGYIELKTVDPCNRIGYRKFYYDPLEVSANQYFDDDWDYTYYTGLQRIYIFRFAHTLLTYAEAAARSGQLDAKAYECVNMIRRRANNVNIYIPSVYDLQTGLSSEAFADSVVWERAWELAGEPEGRWFDMIRLEMVEDLPSLRHAEEGGPPETFDKSAYFYPIPQGDIDLNPELGN